MANNNTTTVNAYDYKPSKEQPQAFQCGGTANAGKVLTVDTDGYIRPKTGGSGATYTGSNGITVDNTAHTIQLNTAAGSTATIGNLTVSNSLTLDKGATFNASSSADIMEVNCAAEFNADALFTDTVDMSTAQVQMPLLALTSTSGTITTANWTFLTNNESGYIKYDNNKYYYVGRTYDTTTTTLVRTLTYYCPKVGKFVITCNDPVAPATEYTYSYAWTSDSLYQHTIRVNISDSTNNADCIISIYNNDSTAFTTTNFKTEFKKLYTSGIDTYLIVNGWFGSTPSPSQVVNFFAIYDDSGTPSVQILGGSGVYQIVEAVDDLNITSCADTVTQLR